MPSSSLLFPTLPFLYRSRLVALFSLVRHHLCAPHTHLQHFVICDAVWRESLYWLVLGHVIERSRKTHTQGDPLLGSCTHTYTHTLTHLFFQVMFSGFSDREGEWGEVKVLQIGSEHGTTTQGPTSWYAWPNRHITLQPSQTFQEYNYVRVCMCGGMT